MSNSISQSTPRPMVSGVVAPLITPLDAQRTVDSASLRSLVDRTIDAGAHALYALGLVGEGLHLTDAERREVLQTVVEQTNGRVPVYAGCIDFQTKRTLALIQQAEECGVDGVVVTTPFFTAGHPHEAECAISHLTTLRENTNLTLILHHDPEFNRSSLASELLVMLAQEGTIQGLQDFSGDLRAFRRLCSLNRAAGYPLRILIGSDTLVDAGLLAGAEGCVTELSCVDPAGYVSLWQAWEKGDLHAVHTAQDRLDTLAEIYSHPFAGPQNSAATRVLSTKVAVHLLGISQSPAQCEPQTHYVDEQLVMNIRALLTHLGLPVQDSGSEA